MDIRSREKRRIELSIGDLASGYGLAPHVLRHWEEVGVLVPARREGGRRRHTEEHRCRVAVVLRAQRAGMSLARIREVLDRPDPAERRAIRTAHLAESEERMTRLREAREIIENEMVRPHEQG